MVPGELEPEQLVQAFCADEPLVQLFLRNFDEDRLPILTNADHLIPEGTGQLDDGTVARLHTAHATLMEAADVLPSTLHQTVRQPLFGVWVAEVVSEQPHATTPLFLQRDWVRMLQFRPGVPA